MEQASPEMEKKERTFMYKFRPKASDQITF